MAGGGLEEDSAYNRTRNGDDPINIASPNKETRDAYEAVVSRLRSPLGTSLLQHFPDGDRHWVEERILFFLSPLPANVSKTDWPLAFNQGYGAGLSSPQLTALILEIQHLLFIHPMDSNSRKLPVQYYYTQLLLPFKLIEQARIELDFWLTGASPSDAASFAFLYSTGVTWDQCRAILGAFSSSLISSDLDPSWEFYDSGPVRKSLSEESIHYLRARLQLTPCQIFAMMKIHSRLSTYTHRTLKSHLDALQSYLQLSSQEVQQLALRSPSVLGVSVKKLHDRVSFLIKEVGLDRSQARSSVLRFPSLLQYSIDNNLRPKVRYFTNKLGISQANFTAMVSRNPGLLGVGLQQKIVKTTDGLRFYCDMSKNDVSIVLTQVPQLLSLNWETNVQTKIIFLEKRLKLSRPEVRDLLMSTPRVLMHSIDRSLEPKIQALESAATSPDNALDVISRNPSLLLSTSSDLNRRISMFLANNITFEESFSPQRNKEGKTAKPRPRKRRAVIRLSEGSIVEIYPDVVAAAADIGTSRANLYNIIKTGRSFKGSTYMYKADELTQKSPLPQTREAKKSATNEQFYQDVRRNFVPDQTRVRLVEVLQRSTHTRKNTTDTKLYMQAFVSARTFPPDKANQPLGQRKAGGLAIHFPQLRGCYIGGNLLRTAAEKCFANQIMSTPGRGTRFCDGLIALGYIYTKPSRNRCSLYVCRDVLRVIGELLRLEYACRELRGSKMDIEIFTDSNYAWTLLNNSTSLLKWGSYASKDDFVYDGEVLHWKANTDILYPLSRTFYRVVNQEFPGDETQISCVKEISVKFRHVSEVPSLNANLHMALGKTAKAAATWQYENTRKALM